GQRGWYFIGVKDFERALPDMEEAVNLNPEAADNYYGLGLAQDALGNTQSALEAYRQYLGLTSNPDSYVVDRVGELEQSADNP
ncbi:MAG: tetratricopeptide repeat protein, partial [Anaerolineae bacterium]|nr:tetratricopeptide repeat protein [Anaerolineae bacterium]